MNPHSWNLEFHLILWLKWYALTVRPRCLTYSLPSKEKVVHLIPKKYNSFINGLTRCPSQKIIEIIEETAHIFREFLVLGHPIPRRLEWIAFWYWSISHRSSYSHESLEIVSCYFWLWVNWSQSSVDSPWNWLRSRLTISHPSKVLSVFSNLAELSWTIYEYSTQLLFSAMYGFKFPMKRRQKYGYLQR